MIHPDSRTFEWINDVAIRNKVKDKSLVEKTIRAFSLLEALVRAGCPLIFKGGTSLMLHLNSAKRLSIDIDIVCPPGTPIEDYIHVYSSEYGFRQVELIEREICIDVPKKHAKYHYEVAYPSGRHDDKILLDVLFEGNHYEKIVKLPIQSPFLKQKGLPILVDVPSHQDLLGDKLTAFAPHTTGIPFFKNKRDCAMEINKQLFDIASLFELSNDLKITAETFKRFIAVESQYRKRQDISVEDVLRDIFNTACCISLRGGINSEEFALLQGGINRVRGFIHGEIYTIERAIVNAAKAAYLSTVIRAEETEVHHFNPDDIRMLSNAEITAPLPTKFNKFKKSNIEAFFYWMEIQKMISRSPDKLHVLVER